MKVTAFYPWYNGKHTKVLYNLTRGIPNANMCDVRKYEECDVAIIFGLVKAAYAPTWYKQKIIDKHKANGTLLVVESAFLNRGKYHAVGWGGIHGNADFKNTNMPGDRWNSFRVKLVDWQKRGPKNPIVVCGQLPRDTNVQDTDHVAWVKETVKYYLSKGIPVRFRPHPRCDDASIYDIPDKLWDRAKIKDTLKTARAVVIYNSTSGIDALRYGVPVIAQGSDAMAAPLASNSLDPKDLIYPDRRQFFFDLAYTQWTQAEMREGATWKHLLGR